MLATVFRDASGITSVGLAPLLLLSLYAGELDANDALQEAYGQAALSVCPAFQQVLDYDADNDEETPEVG